MRREKKAGPSRAPAAEGGPSGVPPRVGSISTKAVTTVGTEEARTKATAKLSAQETSRASTVEGGPSGVPPRVGSISTKAVTTVGTEEARKAASNLPAQEPTRRSTRVDARAVPASVIPTSENYYGNLEKHSAEEENMQSHEH
jgi:hypothetical protein